MDIFEARELLRIEARDPTEDEWRRYGKGFVVGGSGSGSARDHVRSMKALEQADIEDVLYATDQSDMAYSRDGRGYRLWLIDGGRVRDAGYAPTFAELRSRMATYSAVPIKPPRIFGKLSALRKGLA